MRAQVVNLIAHPADVGNLDLTVLTHFDMMGGLVILEAH